VQFCWNTIHKLILQYSSRLGHKAATDAGKDKDMGPKGKGQEHEIQPTPEREVRKGKALVRFASPDMREEPLIAPPSPEKRKR
jgi:hypothetical protein